MSSTSIQKKKQIITGGLVVVLLIAALVCWASARPMALESVKTITMVVYHSDGSEVIETIQTNERVLLDGLRDNFDIEGVETNYGFYVTTVDGEYLDSSSGVYWVLYVNEEKAEYGVDAQPIATGDIFCFCPSNRSKS